MARLIFRDSQGREGTVELSPTETVYVGRGLECAIRTDDGMVSRRHAQIRKENGRFVVEDLGSANGTHLNNTRIQKQALGHADIIQCGSLVIRFVDEGGGQRRAAGMPQPGAGGARRRRRRAARWCSSATMRRRFPDRAGGGGFGGAARIRCAPPGGGFGGPPGRRSAGRPVAPAAHRGWRSPAARPAPAVPPGYGGRPRRAGAARPARSPAGVAGAGVRQRDGWSAGPASRRRAGPAVRWRQHAVRRSTRSMPAAAVRLAARQRPCARRARRRAVLGGRGRAVRWSAGDARRSGPPRCGRRHRLAARPAMRRCGRSAGDARRCAGATLPYGGPPGDARWRCGPAATCRTAVRPRCPVAARAGRRSRAMLGRRRSVAIRACSAAVALRRGARSTTPRRRSSSISVSSSIRRRQTPRSRRCAPSSRRRPRTTSARSPTASAFAPSRRRCASASTS